MLCTQEEKDEIADARRCVRKKTAPAGVPGPIRAFTGGSGPIVMGRLCVLIPCDCSAALRYEDRRAHQKRGSNRPIVGDKDAGQGDNLECHQVKPHIVVISSGYEASAWSPSSQGTVSGDVCRREAPRGHSGLD